MNVHSPWNFNLSSWRLMNSITVPPMYTVLVSRTTKHACNQQENSARESEES